MARYYADAAYTRWRRAVNRPLATKNGKPWTMAERAVALEMRQRGKSFGQIGRRLNRTYDAVAAHLRAFRLQQESRA